MKSFSGGDNSNSLSIARYAKNLANKEYNGKSGNNTKYKKAFEKNLRNAIENSLRNTRKNMNKRNSTRRNNKNNNNAKKSFKPMKVRR